MMNLPKPDFPRNSSSAFTLVEVVLAMAVITVLLTSIAGIMGVLMSTDSDNTERREFRGSVNSIRTYLNKGEPLENVTAGQSAFERVYSWVQGGTPPELLGVSYHADATNQPALTSGAVDATKAESVRTIWFPRGATFTGGMDENELHLAREGRWVSAEISLSPNNPVSTLPASADDYEYAHLVLTVKLNAIENPNRNALTDTERELRPQLEISTVVRR